MLRVAVHGHGQPDDLGPGQSSIERIGDEEIRCSTGEPYPDIAEIEKILIGPPPGNRTGCVRLSPKRFLPNRPAQKCRFVDGHYLDFKFFKGKFDRAFLGGYRHLQ
jgi:hypothetical protein